MTASVIATQGAAASTEPIVELRNIKHRYGNTVALADCRLGIRAGEIHGLVGENGSGKSTVVKLLSGIISPTEGTVAVDGKPVTFGSPRAAQAAGIVTVFQETLIADAGTALDNVFLGSDGIFRRAARRSVERRRATELLSRLGVPPAVLDSPVSALSIAQRQILTIARALLRPWRLLVLDESTSALDIETRDRLFALLHEARAEGKSVLFVSHRMDELELLINRATVQRSGVTVGVLDKPEATPTRLISLMSGKDDDEVANLEHLRETRPALANRGAHLVASGVALRGGALPFDLTIKAGQITGIASLEGHGGSRLAETLACVAASVSGTLTVEEGASSRRISNARNAFGAGVAYVPAKRQEEGLFAPMSVKDNLSMATLPIDSTAGLIKGSAVNARVKRHMEQLAVWPQDPEYPISGLSGGNAQKVLLARWLATAPKVLILNDPLRGVDIGTKRQFYALLDSLAREGLAVVFLSTEIEELLENCDTIAVCRHDAVTAQLTGEEMNYDRVLAEMFGVDSERVSVDPVRAADQAGARA